MHTRTWDAKTNVMLVIEGLTGKPVAESCPEPRIRQSLVLSGEGSVFGPCGQRLCRASAHPTSGPTGAGKHPAEEARRGVACGVQQKRRGARMNRPPSPLLAQRNAGLRPRMREVQAEHPDWGERRLWASLHCIEPRAVTKQRLLRVMREPHLLVTPKQRRNGPVPPSGSRHAKPAWRTTTSMISTQLWGTKRPGSLNGTTLPATGLRSWRLDKWGALHHPGEAPRHWRGVVHGQNDRRSDSGGGEDLIPR